MKRTLIVAALAVGLAMSTPSVQADRCDDALSRVQEVMQGSRQV